MPQQVSAALYQSADCCFSGYGPSLLRNLDADSTLLLRGGGRDYTAATTAFLQCALLNFVV